MFYCNELFSHILNKRFHYEFTAFLIKCGVKIKKKGFENCKVQKIQFLIMAKNS